MKMLSGIKSNTLLVRSVQAGLDLLALNSAFAFAYLLRFDFTLTAGQIRLAVFQMLAVGLFQLLVLRLFNVHKFIWRYISIPELNRIVAALTIAAAPLLGARFLLSESITTAVVPLSIIILDFCLAVMAILGLRLIRREIHDSRHRSKTANGNGLKRKRVLLVGAGKAGVMCLTEIKGRGDIDVKVCGFVDDDELKKGAIINGVKVLGGTADLGDLARSHDIDHVIITIAQATREDFQRILKICRSIPIKVRTIPGLFELLQKKVSVSRIRDIEIEDLLGRPATRLDERSIKGFLKNKVVMVTGAGGSIGSELARQIAFCKPAKLLLVERSENALFNIGKELTEEFPSVKAVSLLRDVCDIRRMEQVFELYRPHVVFHAAAHKHVPMMEFNESEAVRNNVFGTNVVGELAGSYSAESFILISTDKAVKPTSVMGATKRVAELLIKELNHRFDTRFVAVRFGNVIGSNGSVVHTFRRQIKKGGPLTVTHPKMERFFMTITEASQLVLQAGAIGNGGEIFVLDMGDPVKILDLAKETIRLSGLTPGVDIKIEFTDVRPGEKLFEELQTAKEQLTATTHPKILIGQIDSPGSTVIADLKQRLSSLAAGGDDEGIRALFNEFLPEAALNGSEHEGEAPIHISESQQRAAAYGSGFSH